MNESDAQRSGKYVTCKCQHCNDHIEFDASDFNKGETRTVECPHCHLETIIFVPPSQNPPPIPPTSQTQAVKGTILDYTIQTNAGIISGDDGQRYSFQGAEWRETGKYPTKGMRVDFSPQTGIATAIYLIQDAQNAASTNSEKRDCNHVIAGLFGIFLGGFGIHKFYMGYQKDGLTYLLTFVFGFILCGIPSVIIAVIGIIEGIIYLSSTQQEFERKYILNRHNLFSYEMFGSKNPTEKQKTSSWLKRVVILLIILFVLFIIAMVIANLGEVKSN